MRNAFVGFDLHIVGGQTVGFVGDGGLKVQHGSGCQAGQHLPHIPLEEQRQLPRERRRARKGHKMISVRRIRRIFFFKTRDKRMTEVVHIQSANRQPPDTRRALRQFGVLIGGIIIA